MIRAFGILKKAAAEVNKEFGLNDNIATHICKACDEVRFLCSYFKILNLVEKFQHSKCISLFLPVSFTFWFLWESLVDKYRIQTHNHLVHKRTLNHLAKMVIDGASLIDVAFLSFKLLFHWGSC